MAKAGHRNRSWTALRHETQRLRISVRHIRTRRPSDDSRTGRVIVFSALDNLWKGAASQAVQNLNLMFGLDEGQGIS